MGLCQPTVVSCSMDCTCKVWSIMEGTNLRTVAFPCPISGIALDPSETDLYAAGSDGVVYQVALKVENRKPGKLIALSGKHPAPIVSIGLVGGGKSLISAAEDGSVYVRDVETGEVTTLMGNNGNNNISEMVVAKGFGDGRTRQLKGLGLPYHGSSSGLPGKDECALLGKETRRLDKAVKEDRNKAIDMLESAIKVYGSLVELILKEANRD
ncbi:WD repeat-containing protein 18 [Linum perenne]